ncbi:MAG: hypothetical protein AAGD86_07175 [Pseudomonadota bacterium]
MVTVGLAFGTAAQAEDDADDDAALLEFIGSWEGDEDWQAILDDAALLESPEPEALAGDEDSDGNADHDGDELAEDESDDDDEDGDSDA